MTTATTQPEASQRNGQGAPLGNQNAARHGLRGSGLPKGCGHIRRAINTFRRSLESTVFEDRGEVSLADAALINSAFRWERHAQLCQRWLMLEHEKLSDSDRIAYSRDVARASTERDKCIAALKLPKRLQDNPLGLYATSPIVATETNANGKETL